MEKNLLQRDKFVMKIYWNLQFLYECVIAQPWLSKCRCALPFLALLFFCHFNLPSLHLSPHVAHPTWCMQVCAPMHGNEEARAELGLSSLLFPSYSLERVTLTDSQLWKPQQRQTFPLPLSPWLPWDRVADQAKSPHDLPVSAAQGWARGEPAVPDFSQSCWKFTFRSTCIENKCPCPRKHLPSPFSLL